MADDAIKQTRNDLAAYLGEAAVRFGALNEEQRQNTLKTQSRYVALAAAGKPLKMGADWVAPSDVVDDQKFTKVVEALGIPPETLKAALEQAITAVNDGKGIPSALAPSVGDIATQLNYIPAEVKAPLLTAQAGERTRLSARQIYLDSQTLPELLTQQVVVPASEEARNKKLSETINAPKWQRIGENKSEPISLQRAQAANYLGDVLKTMVEQSPSLVADEQSKDKILNATSALNTLSIAAQMQAADSMPAQNANAAIRIRQAATYMAERRGKEPDTSPKKMSNALDILEEGLNTAKAQFKATDADWAKVQGKLDLARTGLIPSQGRGQSPAR